MTKADIVERVQTKTGLSNRECQNLVELFFEVIKKTVESGENVKIAGFGVFEVQSKAERRGRNSQSGKDMIIEARKILTWRSSPQMKARINS